MNLNSIWILDPKDSNKPSVTLTLVVYCFIICTVIGILNAVGKTQNTSIFLDMFWGSLGTYLGRRISFANKTFGSDPAQPGQGS